MINPTSDTDWFGVKLLHKITISGTPQQDKMDEFYHAVHEIYEESIILVKASSFGEAYQIAEKEAKKADDIYKNKYGQMVKREFYRPIDCYHLFDSPQASVEVYSTFFTERNIKAEEGFIDARYSACTVEEMHILRHA